MKISEGAEDIHVAKIETASKLSAHYQRIYEAVRLKVAQQPE